MADVGSKQVEAVALGVPPDFHLHLSADRMTLYIDCALVPETFEALLKGVCSELANMGLGAETYLGRASQRLTEASLAAGELVEFVLLEGKRPTVPREGEVRWTHPYFDTGYEVDPDTGSMDYRRPKGRKSVVAGEHVATFISPAPGEDGQDLTGRTIPASRPKPFRVRGGANITFDEATGKFCAAVDGRLRWVGNVISVDNVYTINGSVGLKTGHIKHPGAIVITGNVDAEAVVEAVGDVEVQGCVENASITTGGSLVVRGGIAGGQRCRIRADGTIQARYIQVANIESGGDVVVEHEIDQCTIRTHGAVMVTHGRIVGGDVIARGGIETDQVGSEAFLRTSLTAGEDYTINQILEGKKVEIDKHRDILKKVAERLTPLKELGRNMPPRIKELVVKLLEEAKCAKESIREIEEEMEVLRAESQAQTRKEILVRKQIFPDAAFHISSQTLLIQDEMKGPLKAKILDGQLLLINL